MGACTVQEETAPAVKENRTMRTLYLRIGLGLLCIVIAASIQSPAQVETGQLAGTVMDPTGAVIPGAVINVKNIGTNAVRSSAASSDGTFRFAGLEAADYEVTVQAASFERYTARVQITVGGHLTLDARLAVSGSATQVEVVGEGGSQINTQSQDLSQV